MASTCPSTDIEVLQKLLHGQLSATQTRDVEKHLLQCDCCAEALDHLSSQDALIPSMKAHALPVPAVEKQVLGGLLERLQAVRSPHVAADAASTGGFGQHDTPSQTAPLEDLTSLLAPPQEADEIGRLGPYRVLKVLGAGGMGVVFEAEDPVLKRSVALKAMRPALAQKADNRQRFLREARATAALEHDHIAAIHHVGEDRGVPFLAMPLLRGETLEMRAAGPGETSVAEVLRIGREVADGLVAAHAHGLMHRDIKPANIWLEAGHGRVKILDFGLARGADDGAGLTQSGVIAGTPAYMAPEQARGEPEPRSDLFSLGCVLYRLTTQRLPFAGTTTMAILQSLASAQPKAPRALNPATPQALSDLIVKLLAKDPKDRPQTAGAVAEALLAIETAEANKARPRRTRPPLRLLAAAVALLAFAAASWLYGAAVYRFATNQGVIVIETDDPDVEVTIRGDVVKVLDAKTGKEVTIKAGKYRPELTKGKNGLRLSTTDFTLERGGRQIVKVAMGPVEHGPKEPFVVLARESGTEQPFGTLAEAVQAARSGDIIEVRGSGPMIREPIIVSGKALTIRAARGSRPVLEFSSASLGDGWSKYVCLQTDAALVLEGLEIRRMGTTGEKVKRAEWAVVCRKAPLRVVNCRIVVSTEPATTALWADGSELCEVRNCHFVLGQDCGTLDWVLPATGRLIWDNNTLARGAGPYCHWRGPVQAVAVQLSRSTFLGPGLHLNLEVPPEAAVSEGNRQAPPFDLEGTANVFSGATLGFYQDFPRSFPGTKALPAAEAEALLRRLVAWRGQRNLHPAQVNFLGLGGVGETLPAAPLQPTRARKTLEDWRQFWATTEAGSLQGSLRLAGGDVWTKSGTVANEVTPADFRLDPKSAGFQAGPDGRDLGPDVDLVGPGPAYENWKKTPAYQRWLKDMSAHKLKK